MPVSGTVVDEAGRPLAGVEVALHAVPTLAERGALFAAGRAYPEPAARGVSDGEGRFRVEAPEAGFWTAITRLRGKAPMEHPLWPLLAPAELEPVELLPDPGLRVLVVDGAGRPLAGAAVAVSGGGPRREPHDRRRGLWRPLPDRVAATGETGRARLPRFEDEETLTLWAVAPGRSLRLEVDGAAAARPVRLVLAPGPVRRLRVTGPGGRPAAGAAVWFSSPLPAGVTSEDGTIAVPLSAESGSGKPTVVQVDAPSGLAAETEVRPPREGEKAPLAVELEEPPRIAGRVLDARERRGVAGALVWLRGDPGSAAGTDRGGGFSLPVRRFRAREVLEAAAVGFFPAASLLHPRGGRGIEEALLLLEPSVVLGGSVVDGAGQPVEGAQVRVAETGQDGWRRGRTPSFGRTDRAGRFQVGGLRAGAPYLAHVARPGYSPAVAEVAPAPARPDGRPGPQPEVRVVLQAGRTLRGRAVDEAGVPVGGAEALLLPYELFLRHWAGPLPGVLTTESDAEGRFELREVLPGQAALRLSAPGRAPADRERIDISPADPVTDLGDLVLEPEVLVEGRVVEPGGAPVPGASVRASLADAGVVGGWAVFDLPQGSEPLASGPDGGFRIGALRAGQVVQLAAEKEGYVDGWANGVRVPTEEPVTVVLRPSATVAGSVVDSRGRPVPEAEVRLSPRAQNFGAGHFRPVAADDRGAFVLRGVPPGLVALEAAGVGYQVSGPVTLELEPGERREGVEIVLERGAVVSGRVLSPDGLPVEAARVMATPTDLSSFSTGRSAVTGPDGRFALDIVAPGRVALEASREGYASGKAEVEVDLAGATVDIHLGRGTPLSGWLLDADGAPAAGRTIELRPTGVGFGSGGKATTALDGSFAFEGVAAGVHRLAVVEGHRSFRPDPDTIVVEDGVPREGVQLRLPRLATLTGRLVGLAPDQFAGAMVGAMQVEPHVFDHGGEILDDGSYRFEGLAPGRWQVTAVHQGLARQAQDWVEIEPGQTEARLDLELRAGHTVTGTVRLGGEPLAGAAVSLSGSGGYQGAGATTGLDGRFRIEGVPTGEHTAFVRDPGSGSLLVEQIEVDGDRDVLLELETSRVSGTVQAADGSGPIAGAGVRLEPDGDRGRGFPMRSETATGADGDFLLTGVAAGRWRLMVEKPGYAAHVSPVEVVGGDVEATPVLLEPAGVLELRVRLADGRTPSSLLVAVVGEGDQAFATRFLRSTGAGRFLLDTLPPGPSELLISAPESPSLRLQVEAPGTAEVVLPEGCTLVVTVPALAEEGSPAAVATASDPSGAPALPSFRANAAPMLSGQAELTQLAPGPWTITVTAVDGRTWTGAVTLAPGPPTRLVLE